LIFCFEKKPGEIWKFRNNFEIQISVPNCFSYFIPVFLGGGRKASVTEMESLRAKVQEAYKNLKAKRREEICSDKRFCMMMKILYHTGLGFDLF
jgi:predicted Zn-dependent protease